MQTLLITDRHGQDHTGKSRGLSSGLLFSLSLFRFLTIWLLLAFFLFFVLSCFKSSFFFFFVLWWSRKQTGTHTHGHLAKRKAKERNIHHGVSAVKTFRVLRARTNIAHLYPTKTTRSALSSAQPSALFLLWVSLSPPLLVVWLGYTYSDSFFFFFLSRTHLLAFLESPWNGG